MKFVAFRLKIAEQHGKEAALRLESAFNEQECIDENKTFLFENMGDVKDIKVLVNTTFEAKAYDGASGPRTGAAPSKPMVYFHSSAQKFLTKEEVAAQDAAAAQSAQANKQAKKGGKQPDAGKGAGKQGGKDKGGE